MRACRWLMGWGLLLVVAAAQAQTPGLIDHRLVIELVAREPDVRTPTGLAVDERGRVWVIENHTHQRPANYPGPASDRIRIFSDFDFQGRAQKISTFADGFRDAMSLALGKPGDVYLATRSEIHLLRDRDGVAGERRVLVKLATSCTYPHNGLSGFAFDPQGNLYFSMGENLGASYELIGADGATLRGGGEGGNIFACRPDGTGLYRVATGFWNTFHLTFDAFGRLFAVDNDPDSRGPCRLLHVVAGGDYGYRFRYGRKGLHPFTAWNGELPSTLPMLAGTAEAPSGIVAYESSGLPADYRGNLLTTSWGDHVVERFQLTPQGASFRAQAQTLARGGEDFRPVAIVMGPDGALYLSDWADKSYPVHGKGCIWRIRMKSPPAEDGLRASAVGSLPGEKLRALLGHSRQAIRAAAGEALAHKPGGGEVLRRVLRDDPDPRARVQALWAAIKLEQATAGELVTSALADQAPEIRAEAARLLGQLLPLDVEKRDERRLLELALKDAHAGVRMQAIAQLKTRPSFRAVLPVLADRDPFQMGTALATLGRAGNTAMLMEQAGANDPRLRLGILLALRRAGEADGRSALPRFLADSDPEVRRSAIQWVAEEQLREFAPSLSASAARPPVTRSLFEALLAANELLAPGPRKPGDDPSGDKFVVKVLQDAAQPAAFRTLALRMLRPDHPAVNVRLLRDCLGSEDSALRQEAVRTLAQRADTPAQEVLSQLARDPKLEPASRAEAVLGLTHSAPSTATQQLLLALLAQPELQRDVLRSLRVAVRHEEVERPLLNWWDRITTAGGKSSDERQELAAQLVLALRSNPNAETVKRLKPITDAAGPRPQGEAPWRALLARGGDPAAGRRVFFHPLGARCFVCHRVDGRGGVIGPDLSTIGRGLNRDKLIDSILTPSKEIAPQFVAWQITTRDGKVRTGVIVDEGPHSTITVADAQGKLEVIHRKEVEERHALSTSIMPDNLHEQMTPREFLDLIAFLAELK